jgi:vacuolar-type H+-ATPase subunit E/Vma4
MDQDRSSNGLLAAIKEQGERERNAVLAEAEAKAREISSRGEAEAARLRCEAMSRLERELAAEGERLLGEARREARNERLAVKRRILAEAVARARMQLSRAATGSGALAALAAEALAAAGEGATVETDAAKGTVIARSRDGRTRVDNSLATRLERAAAVEEVELARLLFGPTESGTRP